MFYCSCKSYKPSWHIVPHAPGVEGHQKHKPIMLDLLRRKNRIREGRTKLSVSPMRYWWLSALLTKKPPPLPKSVKEWKTNRQIRLFVLLMLKCERVREKKANKAFRLTDVIVWKSDRKTGKQGSSSYWCKSVNEWEKNWQIRLFVLLM